MLALALLSPTAAGAARGDAVGSATLFDPGMPRVTIAVLPPGTDLDQITEAAPGIAPGLLGGGLGEVPVAQSYLDMTQGSRLAQSLYPKVLPPVYVTGERVPERIWLQVRTRAAKAPAEIVPGLLAEELRDEDVPIAAAPDSGSAALIAVDRRGRIERTRGCEPGECPGVSVVSTDLAGLAEIAARVAGEDMLIAFERPTGEAGTSELLAAGILGEGFEGDLASSTTRMDGYVLATDILPTVLARYGIDAPDDITGREIEGSGGEADPAAVSAAGDRLGVVRERRSAVLGVNLLAWIGLTLLASAVWRRRGARVGLTLLATAMALVPAVLLLTAALAPSLLAERLIVGLGTPLLAALLLLASRALGVQRPGYLAFAAAAGLSVGSEALDIIAGSPLTARSLIGPNPALGVRFFGIGNELEATIGVLIMLGTGAAMSSLAPRATPARIAAAIVFVTLLAVLVFAPGRLGADVGAAITFPAGAAVAVIVALRLGWRRALLVLLAPVAAVAALLLIDLATGGDAHLSRSVLGAGGIDDLEDVVTRRVKAALRSFPNYSDSPFFIAAVLGIVAGIVQRRRIASWFSDDRAAQAGLAGAIGATVIGTLANDSAALLLMAGTGFIAAFCGLAWAVSDPADHRPGR